MRNDLSWQETNRKHFWWRADPYGKRDPYGSIYAKQFLDDVRNGVMPIGGRASGKPDFRVVLSPPNDLLAPLVCDALQTQHHGTRYSLAEALSDFISDAAWHLAYYGRLYYEIVHGPPHPKMPEVNQFYLSSLPFGTLVKLSRNYLQFVPLARFQEIGRLAITIPRKDLIEITLPKELGWPRQHRRILKLLIQSEGLIPDFLGEDWIQNARLSDFDLNIYANRRFLIALRALHKWGWIHPMSFPHEPITEYFLIYRYYVRFQKTLVLIRGQILEKLNNRLRHIGFPSTIEIHGLPTMEELKDLEIRLKNGKISFDEVLEMVSLL